ncbi:MAG: BREX-6 system adenine-specific DNA-methyltransferase PglX [Nannocystaceae bacterium]
MTMTPEAKSLLCKTIRSLRGRLLGDLEDALSREYKLAVDATKAKLSHEQALKRGRLDAWVDEQVRALGTKANKAEARTRFRGEVVKTAAYTLLNRLVYLRLLEATELRKVPVVTGDWASRGYQDFRDLAPALTHDDTEGYAFLLDLVIQELALDLPGLFGSAGMADLVPTPAATLRHVVETLDSPQLESCWADDMTLGWVYQYWNDPQREALDAKINAGGQIEPHEIASKTQMFTERYMVDWLLQNSVGPMWLAMCKQHRWTPLAQSEGTLARLEKRRTKWRAKREAGEVELTALMPLHTDAERRWAYYVPQAIPDDAVEQAPTSIRELKLLDPAVGSGHFLVVAVDLLFGLYLEEAQHRGEQADPQWAPRAIVENILANNLYGIDLDGRAVQIAAAALWLKAKQLAPQAAPVRLNLVAPNLRLASLPDDDPALVELRQEVERETGIPAALTDSLVHALKGADHLGSLLKVGDSVQAAVAALGDKLSKRVPEQGGLFEGYAAKQPTLKIGADEAKQVLIERIEAFLSHHSGSEDLGLRLRGEQLAAGVRFLRVATEGSYDVVVGNPPYQGTAKMSDTKYVTKHYPLGKHDLYAAFLQRGLELVRPGGVSALLTMRNWMFIKQYAGLREWLLEGFDLRALGDLSSGAFEEINPAKVVVSVVSSIFRRATPTKDLTQGLKSFDDETLTTPGETARKRAAVLCHVGRHAFDPAALKVIPEWPLVYWWGEPRLDLFRHATTFGTSSPARQGLITGDNNRFLLNHWQLSPNATTLTGDRTFRWVPYVSGAEDLVWYEPLRESVKWAWNGAEVFHLERNGRQASRPQNADHYFCLGVAFSMIGARFTARVHRFASVFGDMGSSVFPESLSTAVCSMNSARARRVLESLNPTIHFVVGDVNRLPLFAIDSAEAIYDGVETTFTTHESHREPSVEFLAPGPSPWRYAQDWAQRAVDRPDGEPLLPYEEQLDAEPPTDHVSFALGVALGRFGPNAEGILDPKTADLTHALPAGTLFLNGTLDPDDHGDSLGHAAAKPILQAWDTHAPHIDTKRKHLRDCLRLDFFKDVHIGMYENRPIHWPLSSEKKTFVAWVNIHRWDANTLRSVLAEHLKPTAKRLDGQFSDLRQARDSGDAKAARAAENRLAKLTKARDELAQFITDVEQCAERGPLPPDPKTPAREVDAVYDPDLDDGVMINAAALYPLLNPQWSKPKAWWKELTRATSGKDYDWSHLAMRYWPMRVDTKCKKDPSLGVAHGCFWSYHPERAYAWELRLQDEIEAGFTIDEADSAACRKAFLSNHPDKAEEIVAKEAKRRQRKAAKASKAVKSTAATRVSDGPLFDETESKD